jgi:hypothetical protein
MIAMPLGRGAVFPNQNALDLNLDRRLSALAAIFAISAHFLKKNNVALLSELLNVVI